MTRFLRRLLEPWTRPRLPITAFVICEKGEPVVVCLDDRAVKADTNDRPKRGTRIYRVPLKA